MCECGLKCGRQITRTWEAKREKNDDDENDDDDVLLKIEEEEEHKKYLKFIRFYMMSARDHNYNDFEEEDIATEVKKQRFGKWKK